ncbi:MAG: metal ABC transporter substrate-binding protein [Spirochaetales bacterium]|jgi:zinc transport system substrate-binding protein|nr:metal ABC transporter substrate-binding protein [Spirochaetales bacterium]
MKRRCTIIFILTALAGAALFLTACTPRSAGAEGEGLKVTVTVFPSYDFIRQIAGDKVSLTMLLPPGAESHSFEPTPRDIITLQNSDIFIYVGGESETWVDRILDTLDTSKIRIISLMDIVEVVEEEIVEGMEEEEEEEEGPAYDEHVWTSPEKAMEIVRVFTGVLGEADPDNRDFYQSRSLAYLEELEEVDAAFRKAVEEGRRKTLVFGDRFPFRYFADTYGLSYYAAFPGCSTETECSAGTLAFLIDKVKAEEIPVVFHIELSNEGIVNALAEATGAKKRLLHAAHNVSKRDFDSGVTYLEIMRGNVVNLAEALL